jgi:hypothetical protein
MSAGQMQWPKVVYPLTHKANHHGGDTETSFAATHDPIGTVW